MSAAVGTGAVATRAAESRPHSLNAASSGSRFAPSGVSADDTCTNDTPSSRRTTFLAPAEVIDEPIFGRVAAVAEPLQLGQRHPDHYGEQVGLQVLPAARIRGVCVLQARAGRQV